MYHWNIFSILSKAYDTVGHDILLLKLEKKYGIHGTELLWFNDYLSNRRHMLPTVITNHPSELLHVVCHKVPYLASCCF